MTQQELREILAEQFSCDEEELAGDPPGLGQRMGYKEYGTARPGLILQQ